MLILSKDKAPIQLLKLLHILTVLKPSYCCTKWVSMQSALGKVAAEIADTMQNVSKNLMKQSNVSR